MENKSLVTTNELEKSVKEELDLDDLEDFDLTDHQMIYEVWLLTYDNNYNATDFELLIDDGYLELAEAEKCFKYFAEANNVKEYLDCKNIKLPDTIKHMHLVLESCIDLGDDGTECQDIVEEVEIY